MQRKFVTNLALLLALNLLIKPFWVLGIDRVVQQTVGTAEYGFYFSLFNASFLFNILLDFGITNFNNKNIAQNNHLLSKHLSSILILRLLLIGLYITVTLIAGFIIGYGTRQMTMLAALCFNQCLIFSIQYLRSNLAALHLFATDSIISVLDRLLMILFCGILLWGPFGRGQFKIEWFIAVQTIAYLITMLLTLAIVIDKAKLKRLNIHKAFFIMILKKSYPYAILILLMTFYNRIDTVMLERLLPNGKLESGIYASAYRLLDASNMIAYLFAGLLLPIFSRMLKHREDVGEMVLLAFSLLVVPAISLFLLCAGFNREIMDLLYPGNTHAISSATIFTLLMACFIPVSSSYIFGTLLTANGSLRQLNIMAVSGMVLNISLNLWLIPHYQARGAALASLCTQLITALIQILIAYKFFKLRLNFAFIAKLMVYSLLSAAIIFAIKHYLDMHWQKQILLASLSIAFLATFTHLINIKALFRIIKNR